MAAGRFRARLCVRHTQIELEIVSNCIISRRQTLLLSYEVKYCNSKTQYEIITVSNYFSVFSFSVLQNCFVSSPLNYSFNKIKTTPYWLLLQQSVVTALEAVRLLESLLCSRSTVVVAWSSRYWLVLAVRIWSMVCMKQIELSEKCHFNVLKVFKFPS